VDVDSQRNKEKILCVVLAYFDVESITETLTGLMNCDGLMDVVVLENHSEHTESVIKPMLKSLLDAHKIKAYFEFDHNIRNNAYEVAFDSGLIDLRGFQFVIVTDGDVRILDAQTFYNQQHILALNPDVFVCGSRITNENLPINTFPNANEWLPIPVEHRDYVEGMFGIHMLMFRQEDLQAFLDYRKRKGKRFIDNQLYHFCSTVRGQKWVVTRDVAARHLTWDRLADLSHPYTRAKLSRTYRDTWMHFEYCAYTARFGAGEIRRFPFGTVLRNLPWRILEWTKAVYRSVIPEPFRRRMRGIGGVSREKVPR
jgi:hypothetical protein